MGFLLSIAIALAGLVEGATLQRRGALRRRQAPDSPPEGDSERTPAKCNCDYCISKHRDPAFGAEPTKVAKMICRTPITMSPDVECLEEDGLVKDDTQGIPYIKFCECGCQALSDKEDQQCIALSAEERQLATADDGGCQDPELQTVEVIKQYENADAAAAAAKKAKKAAAQAKESVSTPKQKEQLKTLKGILGDSKGSLEKIKTALGNAKMALEKR